MPRRSSSTDFVQANRIRYLYPVEVRQPGGKLPVGTVTQFYEVSDTRTKPDGSQVKEKRRFYVYQDAERGWQCLENGPLYR